MLIWNNSKINFKEINGEHTYASSQHGCETMKHNTCGI